ncbi:hypothetical protein GJ697_19090 [Pseudoduganella sp. FT25W]|jgi:hypothetical protein|uniref:Uncharacterized protein n=1 Tax=Duganella alba TaxID=2666081 RepID=A0A6L5QKC6_9BURK|nr:hypothetical protein [Duganella alba]MRX09948.1 hypothetical protein [Duganella alba]MRX17585.1 hypothetical protein [Duganella alba]
MTTTIPFPKDVVLTVGFDADQISDQLVHQFTSPDGQQPVHPTGMFEAEIYFCESEVFHFRVVGSGKKDRFTSFQVIDACLVTQPKPLYIRPGEHQQPPTVRYSAPSPFVQPIGATYQMALDFTSDAEETLTDRIVTQEWKRTLNVGNSQGRWEMSLILTVRIFRGGAIEPDVRVFSFDPESEVGSGRGKDVADNGNR